MPLLDKIPAYQWATHYQKQDLNGDLSAGITVAMLLVPQGMSYALLAGLPPVMGIYAAIVPLFLYALLGTSRQLAIGPVAMVALLISASIGTMADAGSAEYIALALLVALMVGVLQLGMGIFKLGFLTNFMSHPVISGFTSAAAIIIIFSQLKYVFGVELPRSNGLFDALLQLVSHVNQTHLITLIMGLSTMALLIALKRIAPKLPAALIAVVLTTFITWLFGLHEVGLKIIKDVPQGLPEFSFSSLNFSALQDMLPIAVTIALIAFMESIAIAKKIAREKRYEVNANQELIAQGAANIGAALFSAMPVAGGFGRTAVNNSAGANTPLASLITAVILALVLLFFTPLFYYLPTSTLGALVIVAVWGLIDFAEIKHLWQVKKEDLTLLLITLFATLIIGVKEGILLGVLVSMLWFVIKSTRPHFAVLGQLGDSDDYRNIQRFEQAKEIEGILILRFDAQFYYGNVTFLKDTLKRLLAERNRTRHIIIEASSVNQLDSSADTALHELLYEFQLKNIELHFASVKGPVRDVMQKSGFWQKLGEDKFSLNVADSVAKCRKM